MTDREYEKKYSEYRAKFELTLGDFCKNLDCKPKILRDSLVYSLDIGGKRVRPVLMYAVAELLGVESEKVADFALALELIHTYSLIHDDLPEMDNDDFRRGKPSNHKVFGVGNAVLAGDGLLNSAFSILLRECRKGAEYIAAAEHIGECGGVYGMIAGQSADLQHENDDMPDEKTLDFIYENKTAKLILAAVMTPSILCGGRCYSELKSFGKDLGFLFQLTDDILDVEGSFDELGKSIGKDESENKFTAVKLYGLDGSKLRADVIAERCRGILEGIDGDREFLLEFVGKIKTRTK